MPTPDVPEPVVIYHRDRATGTVWADCAQMPGWSAAADNVYDVMQLAHEAVAMVFGEGADYRSCWLDGSKVFGVKMVSAAMPERSAQATLTRSEDGRVTMQWDDPDQVGWAPISREWLQTAVDMHNTLSDARDAIISAQSALDHADLVAALLVDTICEQDQHLANVITERDAAHQEAAWLRDRIEDLTAERDALVAERWADR